MTIEDVEAEAMKLSPSERILLAKRLLSAERPQPFSDPDDPVFRFGKNPARGGALVEGLSEVDRAVYGGEHS